MIYQNDSISYEMISCLMKVNPEIYQNDSISYEMISCLMKVNPESIRMIAEMIPCLMKVNFIMIAFHTK